MATKRTADLLKWDREHIVHGRWPIGGNNGIVIEKARGIYFWDTEGKEYIDGAAQLLCVNLGYGQQEIVDAINDEMKKLQYSMLFHGFSNVSCVECSKKLADLVPEGLDHFNFTTGGSESIENALEVARFYWRAKGKNKSKIVALYDSYHGVGNGGITADGVGRGIYEKGFGPLLPGFIHIPSYYCYRCMFGEEYPKCNIKCARYLGEIIKKEGEDNIAAFIAEPELGVGGLIAPPPEYWPIIREICSEYGVLMIADEVMTGFGRTGKMFAVQNWGVTPDIMAMAKGITSAYLPFGAVAFTEEIWQALKGKTLTAYTYSGHPACAAASIKTLEIYLRDKVVANAAKSGEYAMKRLKRDFLPLPCVGAVNGLGLMIGLEIVADKATKKTFDPKLNVMQKIQDQALEKGLFLRTADIMGTPSDRLAFAPPLTVTTKEVDKALDILYPILAALKPG